MCVCVDVHTFAFLAVIFTTCLLTLIKILTGNFHLLREEKKVASAADTVDYCIAVTSYKAI